MTPEFSTASGGNEWRARSKLATFEIIAGCLRRPSATRTEKCRFRVFACTSVSWKRPRKRRSSRHERVLPRSTDPPRTKTRSSRTSYRTDTPSSTTSHFPGPVSELGENTPDSLSRFASNAPSVAGRSVRRRSDIRRCADRMSNESACAQNAQNSALDAYSDFDSPRRSHTSLSRSRAPGATPRTRSSAALETVRRESTQSGARGGGASASSRQRLHRRARASRPLGRRPHIQHAPLGVDGVHFHETQADRQRPVRRARRITPRRSPFKRGTRTFARDVVRDWPPRVCAASGRTPPALCRSVFSWKT